MNGKKGRSEDGAAPVDLEAELDALFKLPLADFTAARNALAARLKKSGYIDKAAAVKSLAKPTISAWAVNQLYWRQRDEFNELVTAGAQFGRAHASQLAGKTVDTRAPLAARREALANLSRLAGSLLREAGHNDAPDAIHRITATLEALSIYSLLPGGPTAGRLTEEVDPPGFESLASLLPASGLGGSAAAGTGSVLSSGAAAKSPSAAGTGSPKEQRTGRIAAAKVALRDAETILSESRSRARETEAILKKAVAHADQLEKSRREAEQHFNQATVAAEDARQQSRHAAAEAGKAAKVLASAEYHVEKARRQLAGEEERDG